MTYFIVILGVVFQEESVWEANYVTIINFFTTQFSVVLFIYLGDPNAIFFNTIQQCLLKLYGI